MPKTTAPKDFIQLKPTEITTQSQLDDMLDAVRDRMAVAIDTETTGLDWSLGDRAFMATFATSIEHLWYCYDVLPDGLLHKAMLGFEKIAATQVYHNCKFDEHQIRMACGWIPECGYAKFTPEDTMLLMRIVNPLSGAKLKVGSQVYCPQIDVAGPQKQLNAWKSGHVQRRRINKEWVSVGILLDEDTPYTPSRGGESGVLPKGTIVLEDDFNFSMYPRSLMNPYATQDAVLTIVSYEGLQKDLTLMDPTGTTVRKTYDRDRNVIGRLINMELHGWPVDGDDLKRKTFEAKENLDAAIVTLKEQVGLVPNLLKSRPEPMELNPFSTPQLQRYLYEIRGFPEPPNKTKAGNPATDEAALIMIPDKELGGALLGVRRWQQAFTKYREVSTYASKENDWTYVHGEYHADIARTGRLSMTAPALQNTATPRSDRPWTQIRSVFQAKPGKELLFWDLSNIEMVLFAQYSQDPVLLDVFERGGDAHYAVAAKVYGKPEAEVTPTERKFAKTLSFSLLYGAGANRIYESLRYGGAAGDPLTEEEMRQSLEFFEPESARKLSIEPGFKRLAQCLVLAYYEMFPTVKALNKQTSGSIITRWNKHGRGYVRNLYGREVIVGKARAHTGTNALIQSTAADLFKSAILRVDDILDRLCADRGLTRPNNVALFGNIHDELITDEDEGLAQAVARVVGPAMCHDPRIVEYAEEQRVKNPDYRLVPIKVKFSIAHAGVPWSQKEDLVLA